MNDRFILPIFLLLFFIFMIGLWLLTGYIGVGEAKERCLKGAGAIGEEADFSSTIKWYGMENECVYVLSDGTKVNSDQYCGYIIRKFKEMME